MAPKPNLIIRTNETDLFRVNKITFTDASFVCKIKEEPLRLFFSNGPLCIEINEDKQAMNMLNLDQLLQLIDWFESNMQVDKLTLHLDNLNEINMSTFRPIRHLHELTIVNNQECLNSTHVGGLSDLKCLNLVNRHGMMRNVEMNAFSSLVCLEQLNMSKNSIETIHSSAFFALVNLKMLKLRGNHIEFIDSYLFRDLVNLLDLDLSFNNISQIGNV